MSLGTHNGQKFLSSNDNEVALPFRLRVTPSAAATRLRQLRHHLIHKTPPRRDSLRGEQYGFGGFGFHGNRGGGMAAPPKGAGAFECIIPFIASFLDFDFDIVPNNH